MVNDFITFLFHLSFFFSVTYLHLNTRLQTTFYFVKKALNHPKDLIKTLFERIDNIKLKTNFEISYIPAVMNFIDRSPTAKTVRIRWPRKNGYTVVLQFENVNSGNLVYLKALNVMCRPSPSAPLPPIYTTPQCLSV